MAYPSARGMQRGQLALDLLLSLLVLLIVLTALGSVLNHFESTQKELSLHQQLREDGITVQYLLSSAISYYHEPLVYSGNPDLVHLTNAPIRVPGNTPLSALVALKTPQGFSCGFTPVWSSVSSDSLQLSIAAADTELSDDVEYAFSFSSPDEFRTAHSLSLSGCYGPFAIEVNP